MVTLYRNTRALRVRFLQVLFWAATFGFVVMSFLGGPDPNSWVVGAILAPIFALFAVGMEWYLRCYVTTIEATDDFLALETLSTFGRTRRNVPWADVELAGELSAASGLDGGPVLDNSASFLRIRGRAFLIIDTTADPFDVVGLKRMLVRARKA
jgi:hypothetical protein